MTIGQRNANKCEGSSQIYVGLDVHKAKWVVSIFEGQQLVKTYSQSSCVKTLINYLKRHYCGCEIEVAYEAGFSGYWIHRELESCGIKCLILHAADIPSSDWERRRKNDKIDSKKIGKCLSKSMLKGIYVPSLEQEQIRERVRLRLTLAKDKRRYMCRIRSYLLRHGLDIPQALKGRLWTKAGYAWLGDQVIDHPVLGEMLITYQHFRQRELQVGAQLRKHIQQSTYDQIYQSLLTIPGVGWCTASLLIGELGDLKRFKRIDELASYCGLVPDTRSSAEKTRMLGMSRRGNRKLRTALVESAWIIKRMDPQLAQIYSQAIEQGKPPQKAIVKVSRKLLNRIRAIWLSGQKYVLGYSEGLTTEG